MGSLGGPALCDGNYRAMIPVDSASDLAGNALMSDYTLDLLSLAANANHDRFVNTIDFNALAKMFESHRLPPAFTAPSSMTRPTPATSFSPSPVANLLDDKLIGSVDSLTGLPFDGI